MGATYGSDFYLDQNTTAIFTITEDVSSMMGGSGNLTKEGPATLSLDGQGTVTTFSTGVINLNQATTALTGIFSQDVNVASTAFLKGNATMVSIVNNGTVRPGNSIGIFHTTTSYTQNAGAALQIELDTLFDQSNLLSSQIIADDQITINPNSNLELIFDSATYFKGRTAEYLISQNGLTGTFTDVTTSGQQGVAYQLIYQPNIALVEITENTVGPPGYVAPGKAGQFQKISTKSLHSPE